MVPFPSLYCITHKPKTISNPPVQQAKERVFSFGITKDVGRLGQLFWSRSLLSFDNSLFLDGDDPFSGYSDTRHLAGRSVIDLASHVFGSAFSTLADGPPVGHQRVFLCTRLYINASFPTRYP